MTDIAFHFGAPDKLAYACRLLRKAAGSGARVLVVADPGVIARLDADLWALSATDFVSHCTVLADASVQQCSSVVLTSDRAQTVGSRDVLVNLADSVPPGFDQFKRLIEVVSTDDQDRALARDRWKAYTGWGYAITRHDLALKSAD